MKLVLSEVYLLDRLSFDDIEKYFSLLEKGLLFALQQIAELYALGQAVPADGQKYEAHRLELLRSKLLL
jgi:hypothetical protein